MIPGQMGSRLFRRPLDRPNLVGQTARHCRALALQRLVRPGGIIPSHEDGLHGRVVPLPDPDVRGGGGSAHKWFEATIRGSLSKIAGANFVSDFRSPVLPAPEPGVPNRRASPAHGTVSERRANHTRTTRLPPRRRTRRRISSTLNVTKTWGVGRPLLVTT
jgi:hypothetical protein